MSNSPQLPKNLIAEAKMLGQVIKKTRDGKRLTAAEAKVVARYQGELDEEAARTYVGNQLDLGNKLGVARETISRKMKEPGCPGRSPKGYCLEDWRDFLAPEMEGMARYDVKTDASAANSAEIHQAMLKKSKQLHQKLELAEKKGDVGAIAFFEKRWLDVSRAAKDFENLIQKHELDIGETIKVSEMERVEALVILAMLDASNRFIDEFSIIAEGCDNKREIRAKAEAVFEEMVKLHFQRAVQAKKLDPRVLSIWDRSLSIAESIEEKPAPKKKTTRKKK